MSQQFILDDHLGLSEVFEPVERWATACYLRDLRPGETIKDDRIPAILLTLNTPTFLTIDHGFGDRRWCHPGYGMIQFDISVGRQVEIPDLLRQLVNPIALGTRRSRMGSVVRIDRDGRVELWRHGQVEEIRFTLTTRR